MVQVYREPICRRHYSNLFSASSLLRIAVILGSIALAFLLAFATGGFWRKTSLETEQPTVHYTGDGLAIFEGLQPGQEQVWSTSASLQDLLGSNAAAMTVQVGELDQNCDGKPDVIHLKAKLASPSPIHSIKLLLQFTYTLKSSARLSMYGLAYIQVSSPLPGASFSTDGQVVLQQHGPMRRFTYNGMYNTPLIGSDSAGDPGVLQAGVVTNLASLLSDYSSRNLTAVFVSQYPVWTATGASSGGSSNSTGSAVDFGVDVRIRIPPHQLLLYRPPLGEALKWGWVQFLAAFIAVWWLASWFEWAVFRFRILETRVVSDVQQQRAHKF